jgi:hypothetical protein
MKPRNIMIDTFVPTINEAKLQRAAQMLKNKQRDADKRERAMERRRDRMEAAGLSR